MKSLIASRDGQIGIINSDSGAFELLTTDRVNNLTDIAVASDGSIFAITFDTLYTIDETTKEFVEVGAFGNGAFINSIGFSGDGQLLGVAAGSSEVYNIDTTTGNASAAFDIGGSFRSSGDLEFDTQTRQFFATSTASGSDTLYSFAVDSQTGGLAQVTEIGSIGFDEVWGLSSSADGLLGYTSDRREIIIDTSTGAGSLVRTITGLSGEIAGSADLSRTEDVLPEEPLPEEPLPEEPFPEEPIFDRLEAFISSPTSITASGTDKVTVTYTNTGVVDIAAPLLSLSTEGAQLRLDDESGFSESQIQFLAINNEGVAGILPPGVSNSFTIEFMPDVDRDRPIDFSVNIVDDSAPIDWEALRDQSRPDYISSDAWQQIYDNFVAEVGTTASDYRQLITENASYLSQLGQYVADADTLLAFEFQQASDFQSISQQYNLGSFGIGQSFIGDLQLTTDVAGDVAIDNGGTRRSFDLSENGTYRGLAGDRAILSLNAATGTYTLQEPDGTQVVFNTVGKLDYIEDTNGNRITAAYTNDLAPNQLTRLADDFGNETVFDYNSLNRIESITTPDGRTTAYTYDVGGTNLETITDELGTTTYAYAGAEITSITDPSGTRLDLTYDDRGRVSQERLVGENGASETLTYRYDSAGGVTVVDSAGNETALLLNENGQIGQLTDANGQQVRYSYDGQGNLVQVVGPENNTSLFGYDSQGNLTTQVNPLGDRTQFTYESTFNQLTSVTDARGNGMVYGYDTDGNLTEIEYEDGSQETFEYSDRGQITASVNRRGQRMTYTYNEEGELFIQQALESRDFTVYTYDESGYLDLAIDKTGVTDLDYDVAGRLTKITYSSGRFLSYTYDESDRRTSMADQDGNVTNYAYDELGRLSGLTDGAGDLIVEYEYDAVGRLAREDKGNGTYALYAYDNAGQLLSIVNHAPDDSINSSAVYTYDELGRQSSQTTLEGQWTYYYDAAGQLIGAEFDSVVSDISDQSLLYEYDTVGNRIRTVENGETTEYETNNLNQYTEVGGFEYEYDADGNLTAKTDETGTSRYGYDSENRLISVTEPDGVMTTYEYNAFGDRTASVRDSDRTEYLIDPFGYGDVVGEYDVQGNVVARYTHGLGLETLTTNANNHYYDFNIVGSTTGITDNSGKVVNNYFYLPFGKSIAETETVSNSFEFVGQYGVAEEEHGLDFMRERFYGSDIGRFTSADPIGLNGGDTNLYRYVQNNPIEYIDPEGTLGFLVPLAAFAARKVVQKVITRAVITGSANVGIYLATSDKPSLGGGIASFVTGGVAGGSTVGIQAIRNLTNPGARTAAAQLAAITGLGLGAIESALVGENVLNTFLGLFPSGTSKLSARFSEWLTADKDLINEISNLSQFIENKLISEALKEELDTLTSENSSEVTSSSTNIEPDDGQNSQIPFSPNNRARSKGEPHLTTFDGIGYDFQAAGDFTLVESADGDFDIQVRYVQIDSNVTVASAVATEVDGQTVVIDSEGIEFVPESNDPNVLIPRVNRSVSGREATVTVDGQEVEIASGGSFDIGNSRLYRSSGSNYTLVYAGDDGIISDGDDQLVVNNFRPGTINTVDVYLGDEQKDQITGLLGNLNDNPNDDIALRDGTVLSRPLDFDRLYGDYSNDYRIKSADDSLFTYEPGKGPDTFYNPNFPAAPFTFDDLDPAARARGEAAALAAGYTPGTFGFESAAFDFAVTGETGFLEGAENALNAEEVSIVVSDNEVGTSSLQGIVFNDLNGNGIRDSELVQGENPDVVFVVDVSGSTETPFQGTPVGDVNDDGLENTILDAELAGLVALNQQLIAQGLGDRIDVGLVLFGENGVQVNLQPTQVDKQLGVTPNTDLDNNSIPDIEDTLKEVTIGGNGAGRDSTNFKEALALAKNTFETLETSPGEGNLIFLSDGEYNGSSIEDEVQQLITRGINLSAFGVGRNASLLDLQDIDPNADELTSTDELLGVFSALEGGESQSILEPTADGIIVYLDANGNSILDVNELAQVTDQLGQYSFTDLLSGSYTVREVLPSSFVQTAPANGFYDIQLGVGDVRTELNFANTSIDESTVLGLEEVSLSGL